MTPEHPDEDERLAALDFLDFEDGYALVHSMCLANKYYVLTPQVNMWAERWMKQINAKVRSTL